MMAEEVQLVYICCIYAWKPIKEFIELFISVSCLIISDIKSLLYG